MKQIISLLLAIFIASCAHVNISVRDEARGSAPRSVLIGRFENRVLDYNPFVVGNFRDSLACEFFARGYTVRHLPPPDSGKDQSPGLLADITAIRELALKQDADLVIQGTVFEARYGDAVEDRTSTAITLTLYNKTGALVGTARFIAADTLADAGAVRALSGKMVQAIHSKLSNE